MKSIIDWIKNSAEKEAPSLRMLSTCICFIIGSFLFITICVGICISFTGPIGFVGLVIPHIVKLIYKQSATKLFIPTLFFGGTFLVFCDLISRVLPTASSLPIGVVTAFIGAPFFVYLLIRK